MFHALINLQVPAVEGADFGYYQSHIYMKVYVESFAPTNLLAGLFRILLSF